MNSLDAGIKAIYSEEDRGRVVVVDMDMDTYGGAFRTQRVFRKDNWEKAKSARNFDERWAMPIDSLEYLERMSDEDFYKKFERSLSEYSDDEICEEFNRRIAEYPLHKIKVSVTAKAE